MSSDKRDYTNPARRDLLKQLAAMGVIGASGTLQSPLLFAESGEKPNASMPGSAIWRDNPDYENIRRIMLWKPNTPARFPDVMAHAKSDREIIESLHFAKENDLQVVCRASGHNTAGAVLRNGGMMLDISNMYDISIDSESKTASVQPGAKMAQFAGEIAQQGLAFPTADCHTVALAGYLLGGGHGLNGKHWGQGPACYSIISADVILANGEKVTASKDSHPDLYWAIRGVGPGFFGVITRFQLQLYQPSGSIIRNSYEYDIDSVPSIIKLLDQLEEQQDERVSIGISVSQSHKKTIAKVSLTAHAEANADSVSIARSMLSAYVDAGISKGALSKKEYQSLQPSNLMYTPNRGFRTHTDNIYADDANAFLPIVEHFKNRPAVNSFGITLSHNSQMFPFREDACYSAAGKHFVSNHILWDDEKDDEAVYRWYDRFNELLKPFKRSHYINQVDNERNPDRARECFSEANWQRLIKVRQKYDPDNLFYSYLGN